MSSPSLSPSSLEINGDHDQSSLSSDDCSSATMPIIANVQSIKISKSKRRPKAMRTSLVSYGPIRIRKRHSQAPTLATGRRSKDDHVEGEEFYKREMRRIKNRESARNLKKLRDDIEENLEKEVKGLEYEEHKLSTQIKTLQIYKQYLEEQFRQTYPIYEIISRTASAVLAEFKRQHHHQHYVIPKEESRSASPEWQLLFSI